MMKIKRFNESEDYDISPERTSEIIEELKNILSSFNSDIKNIELYINELNNYKSNSKKGNDQIDDSISALEITRKDLENSIDKVDTVVSNLLNYNDNGREFLYSE